MDIDGLRMTFGRENKLDRVDIVPEKNVSLETVRHNLEARIGTGLHVDRPEEQSESTEKVLASYQLILTFFSFLALLVGLFLVMNSISVAIAERKREIGILRALGATRISMVILFVTEVFGIGFFGSALGALLGKALAYILSNQVTASVAIQLQTQIVPAKLELTPSEIIFTIVCGTLASVVAAFIPALKAATIHPLESMKKNAESSGDHDDKMGRILIVVGLVLLIFNTFSVIYGWGALWWPLDFVSKGSSVVGAALFGPFLVFLLLRAFRFLTLKSQSPILKLSQENLMRSRKRTSANVMALMVGLFLVMIISTIRVSFHDTLTTWLDRIFVADIMVASSGRFITADVQLLKEEVASDLYHVKGIRPIDPGRGAAIRIVPFQYEGDKMMIKALDHYSDYYHYRNFAVPGGDSEKTALTLFDTDEPHVLATQAFLDNHHLHVGDLVSLDTPNGKVPFQITGKITDYASPKGVFYMSRSVYKKYWKDSLVSGFLVDLAPGATFDQVREEIDKTLGKKWSLVTISNREFKNQMQNAIDRSFAYTRAIELIALLVGLLGLLNTLLISVLERTREIGMLRAVGSTRGQISRMIFIEAILQGFFGAVVAIVLGSWMGSVFVKYGLSAQLGWSIDYYFPRDSIASILITGIVVAALAGFWPARRASHLDITEALDYE
jgi:putative ABC transport system permease protein